jgi:Fe2+ transport system protein FeoA
LLDALPGETVEVVSSVACSNADSRLRSMGIVPGARILVDRSAPLGGPLLIDVCGLKIALGRGVAAGVLVSPASPPNDELDTAASDGSPWAPGEGPCGSP